jgi:uncharacterized cupredoxin-like copper-binding protein
MTRRRAVVAAALAAPTAVSLAGCAADGDRAAPKVRTVVLDVRYSMFSTSSLTVRPGEVVRFVVRNHDPIPHELVIGDQAVQDYHEQGTDTRHARPGEVSVGPSGTAVTTYTFLARDISRSDVFFGCHLPGHWAYGMRGTIRVT